MKASFPSPGDTFEEKYRIEAILGSGGFARVYRAVEEGLDRRVALKILRPPMDEKDASDSERDNYMETLMERFQREAQLLSKLHSPHTVTMYHYGKTDGGLLYMVLEYIDGLSLAELMRAGKALHPARVLKVVYQVLQSLREAHAMGMLHRDLKPANVMVYEHLGEKDQVKLLDFGIAKLVTDAHENRDLTGDGTLIGTPRYMAPEQIQGKDEIHGSADIYSLGLVCYELLTAERAIKGESSVQIIGKQLEPEPFRLPEDAEIPPKFRAVINKMLAKDLEKRYETCDEVIHDLESPDILDPDVDDVPEIDAAFIPIDEAEDDEEVEEDSLERFDFYSDPSRKRSIFALALLALLFVAGIVGFQIFTDDEEPGGKAVAGSTPARDSKPPAKPDEPDEPSAEEPLEEDGAIAFEIGEAEAVDAGESQEVRIVSNMEGVEILVDGEPVGTTPDVVLTSDKLPALVTARYKSSEKEQHLDEPTEELRFDFDPPAKVERPKPPPRPLPESESDSEEDDKESSPYKPLD